MICELIFEEAYRAALRYKSIVDSGMADTDKGHELFGYSRAFSNFIANNKLNRAYEQYLIERKKSNGQ